MLDYKKTRSVFYSIMVIIAIVVLFNLQLWYLLLLPIIAYNLILIYGSISIQSNFFVPSISYSKIEKKQVALTFDDGPKQGKTDLILNILKKNNIEAAFFCIGNNIKQNPELLKKLDLNGHIIGNHSFNHHFFFDLLSEEKMILELKQTHKIIKEQIDKDVLLFRPPYGVTNPNLANAISKLQYQSIGWSLRTMDTSTKLEQKLVSKIESNLKSGDIILLHDTVELTVMSLQKIIDVIKNKGFEIIRLDKLLNIKAYA